jgi:hypothetical protein
MSTEHRSDGNSASRFEENTKRAFDAGVGRLDGATRSRLAQARAAAIDAAGQPEGRRWLRLDGVRVAALGVAAMLAVAVVWLPQQAPEPAVELTAFDDLDILLDEEELDLFEELEFYAWLDAQAGAAEVAVDADGSG